MTVVFEDRHEYDGSSYYMIPNEETLAWRELIKEKPIYRAASICSSGEVGFFGILPLVRSDLIMVDHCYQSLHIAMLKYLIIKSKGYAEAIRLFTTADAREVEIIVNEVNCQLPEKIKIKSSYWRDSNPFFGTTVRMEIGREWQKLPQRVVKKASTKLGRVKFVHGDLRDLKKDGPFGLLYLSNALDHTNRDRKRSVEVIREISEIVKPGGYVFTAVQSGDRYGQRQVIESQRWELLKMVKSNSSIRWDQCLYQIPS